MNFSKFFLNTIQNYSTLIIIILLISAGFLVYGNSLHSPFILDDDFFIVKNPDLRRLDKIITRLIYSYDKEKGLSYYGNDPVRPLTYLTFALNYYFGKLNTFGYHLFNVLMHIFAAVSLFFLTKKILAYTLKKYLISLPLLVSLFFLVHPANTEVVSYIYQRSESLAMFFYVSALLFFSKTFEKQKYYYVLSLFCFVLALFSKQTAITLPVILIFFDYLFISDFDSKKVWQKRYYYLFLGIILAGFVILRYTNGEVALKNPFPYLTIQPYVISKYIVSLFIPGKLCFLHSLDQTGTILNLKIGLPWVSLLIIFLSLYKVHQQKTSSAKIIIFAAAWFFVTLLPTSSIFRISEVMADRRIYLPSFGFYLLLGFSCFYLASLSKPARLIITFFLLICLLLLGKMSGERNKLYQNPLLLWQEVTAKYPENHIAHNNIGVIHSLEKKYKLARANYERALELKPGYVAALNNLGFLHQVEKNYGQALKIYQQSLELKPNSVKTHYLLATLYQETKQYPKAVKEYQTALKTAPNFIMSINSLVRLYCEQKEYTKAFEECKKILELDPDFSEAHFNLGLVYQEQKDYRQAIRKYHKVLELNPDFSEAYFNLGIIYKETQSYAKAIASYLKVLQLDPRHVSAYNNLGILYKLRKQYPPALAAFKKALAIDPDYAVTYNNLASLYYEQQQYKKALEAFNYYLKFNPQDSNINEKITLIKKLLKNPENQT